MINGRDLRYNREESLNIFHKLKEQLPVEFDINKLMNILEWVESGEINKLLFKAKGVEKKTNVFHYVDIHYLKENETQKERQDNFKKDIVEKFDNNGMETIAVNFHKELRAIIGEYDNENYLIRVMYLKDNHDSIIYLIKKSDNLEDIQVTVNRIPNELLEGKQIIFVQTENKKGIRLKVTKKEI